MIFRGISAFIGTVCFAIYFNVPKKYIVHSGITGGLGWVIYLLLIDYGINKVYATFGATLMIAFTSHIMARCFKSPVTIFFIPGVLPLVPGAGMYQIVSSIIENNKNMVSYYSFETLQVAGAIALGIFVVDTMFRKKTHRLIRIPRRK